MEQSNPVQFMIQNRAVIMAAYRDAKGSPSKAWKALLQTLPEIEAMMSLNTFKPYIGVFVAMAEELEKAEERNVQEPAEAEEVIQPEHKNIDGWTVQQGNDGYFRLYKKIDGKVKTLYLGKELSIEKARKKIREFKKGKKRRVKTPATAAQVDQVDRAEDLGAVFRAAYDQVGHGRGFVRIHRVREALGWTRETFDQVLLTLRQAGDIVLNVGDPSGLSEQEIKDSFMDETGTLFITMTWRDGGSV